MAVSFSLKKRLLSVCLVVPTFYAVNSFIAPVGASPEQQHESTIAARDPETSLSSLLLEHQGMVNPIQFSLDYGLKDNGHALTDDVLIHETIRLLTSYPEEYVYWEIVNLAITQQLLDQYPQLNYITLQLRILPRGRTHHFRASTVTRWGHGSVEESWRFKVDNLAIQGTTWNAAVSYTYQDAAIYPDYLDVYSHLMDYLDDPRHTDIPPAQLESTLTQHLLSNYSGAISNMAIELQ